MSNRPNRSDRRPGDEWRRTAAQVDRAADALARASGFFLAAWAALVIAARLGVAAVDPDWMPAIALALVVLSFALMAVAAVGRRLADGRDGQHQGGESK